MHNKKKVSSLKYCSKREQTQRTEDKTRDRSVTMWSLGRIASVKIGIEAFCEESIKRPEDEREDIRKRAPCGRK